MANVHRLQRKVELSGWYMAVQDRITHSYSLDDDPDLQSITFSLRRTPGAMESLTWRSQQVPHELMPAFYGRSVTPPFPNRIDVSGAHIFEEHSARVEIAS